MQVPSQINTTGQHSPEQVPDLHSSEEWRLTWEREDSPEVRASLESYQ